MNPKSWKFHTAIWSVFYAVNISIDYVIAKGDRPWGWDWFKLAVHKSEIAFQLQAMTICYLTIWLSSRIFKNQPVLFFIVTTAPMFVLSLFLEFCSRYLTGICQNNDCSIAFIVRDSAATSGLIVIFGSMIRLFIDALNSEKRKMELSKEKDAMELAFLKSQINPHFLFNTLNNLYGLSLSEPDKTPDAIVQLSDMMRYMLYESNSDKVLLEKEIAYLKSYIDLQKLRYFGTTFIDFKINGDLNHQQIAPLLLISFVENAFKHGDVFDEAHPLSMTLNISEKQLIFDVKNKIHNKNKEEIGGFGVKTVERRLALLYPNKHKLTAHNNKNIFESHLEIEL
jgi:two-component system, LytTR family, sensor kinase